MKATLHYEDDRLRITSTEQVLIAVWRNVPTMEHMRALETAGDAHRDALAGAKQAFVNVVIDGMPGFSNDVRKEAARHAKRSAAWRVATAHVMTISGMRGVAVRSFMSTMLLLARPSVPTAIFDGVKEAMQWLLPHLGSAGGWTEARLMEAYQLARGPAAR